MPESKNQYESAGDAARSERESRIERIAGQHARFMHLVGVAHSAEFVEIGVTMGQAKLLHLVATAGELHMSVLTRRLGVSLSTVSGLVDRLVESGLADRRDDPVDRRQVVVRPTSEGLALFERFRDLSGRHLRLLLGSLDIAELDAIERAYSILTRAAAREFGPESDAAAAAFPPSQSRKGSA